MRYVPSIALELPSTVPTIWTRAAPIGDPLAVVTRPVTVPVCWASADRGGTLSAARNERKTVPRQVMRALLGRSPAREFARGQRGRTPSPLRDESCQCIE